VGKFKDNFLKEKAYPHGIGRMMYCGTQGSYIIEGHFIKGQATGFARWIWEDGLTYTGHLKNFKCHGQGTKILG
jgi:hypothetical protein